MIIRVRKIGNSTGVILPKNILEQCSIRDEVSVEVKDEAIIIQSVKKKPREGWEQQFIAAGSLNDQQQLLPELNNSFDQEEWAW